MHDEKCQSKILYLAKNDVTVTKDPKKRLVDAIPAIFFLVNSNQTSQHYVVYATINNRYASASVPCNKQQARYVHRQYGIRSVFVAHI